MLARHFSLRFLSATIGLEWIHSPAPLAHPLDDGTAVMLERDLPNTQASLGVDGKVWQRLVQPFAERWSEIAPDVLRPAHLLPKASVADGGLWDERDPARQNDCPQISERTHSGTVRRVWQLIHF